MYTVDETGHLHDIGERILAHTSVTHHELDDRNVVENSGVFASETYLLQFFRVSERANTVSAASIAKGSNIATSSLSPW